MTFGIGKQSNQVILAAEPILRTRQKSSRGRRLQRELGRAATTRGGEGGLDAVLEVDAGHVVEEVSGGAGRRRHAAR